MWFLQYWRRRWGSTGIVTSTKVPSPTRLAVLTNTSHGVDTLDFAPTLALLLAPLTTTLLYLSDTGEDMATPLLMTAGESGSITFACVGADGQRQDLTGATVTLRVVMDGTGTAPVNNVALTLSDAANGEVTWARTALQTATASDYHYQIKAVLADASVVYFPDGLPGPGNALTILRAL